MQFGASFDRPSVYTGFACPWLPSGALPGWGGRLTDPNPAACRTGLHPYRLAVHIAEAPGLVAHAHQKHRLARVLEDVDNALVAVFKINGLAVGDQMQVGSAL